MEAKEILPLLIISVLPIFLIGLYIYKKDKNKEPASILIKLFFGGLGPAILTLILTLIMDVIFPVLSTDFKNMNIITQLLYVFLSIALVEEASKWLFSYFISYDNNYCTECGKKNN